MNENLSPCILQQEWAKQTPEIEKDSSFRSGWFKTIPNTIMEN